MVTEKTTLVKLTEQTILLFLESEHIVRISFHPLALMVKKGVTFHVLMKVYLGVEQCILMKLPVSCDVSQQLSS